MIHTHFPSLTRVNLFLIMLASLMVFGCQPQQKGNNETDKAAVAASTSLLLPEQLHQVVPDPPEGFQLADQRQNIDTSTGVEISNLSLVFRNEASETFILSLQDYLNHAEFFSLANSLWNDEMAFERDGSYARRMELPEMQEGWTSYDAEALQGIMMIGVNKRFLASVRTEQIKDISGITEWMQSGWLSTLP